MQIMIIDCISDLHGYQPKLRGGDLLIIAGDMTARDKVSEWNSFYEWLYSLNYRQIVYIAGNHDGFLEQVISSEDGRELLKEEYKEPSHIEYLRDNFFMFEGIKIYGMPWTPMFCNWHFMKDRDGMREKVSKIPEDVDILITHGPSYGILDACPDFYGSDEIKHAGCYELTKRLKDLKQLKLHVFGHIHEDYGVQPGKYLSVNASIMDGNYRPINKPIRTILVEKQVFLEEEIPKD